MAHIDDFFPSRFLKASDLQGRDIKVFIDHVEAEDFENDGKTERKPVVFFQGKEKGIVLNKTNAGAIAQAYGYDYTSWRGSQITLYTAMVDAWGETKEAIRVRVTAENMRAVNDGQPEPDPTPVSADTQSQDEDDDLPF